MMVRGPQVCICFSLALLAFWQGEYMVVEAVVVWELPSLALMEGVCCSRCWRFGKASTWWWRRW